MRHFFGGGSVTWLDSPIDDRLAQILLERLDPGSWRAREELHEVIPIERAFQFGERSF